MDNKVVLITQSNYIPWKGYFDAINQADVFVIYDEMQYTKRDWRNRNRIKTVQGSQWLSIPVTVKGKFHQKINETVVSNQKWRKKHWNTLKHTYAKTPFFKEYASEFKSIYDDESTNLLSQINYRFIVKIMELLDIDTQIIWSADLSLQGGASEKLLNICKALEASTYISGPAAKDYLEVKLFEKYGISVKWLDYSNYPEYEQLYPPFDHAVTILDMFFHLGSNVKKYMKTF